MCPYTETELDRFPTQLREQLADVAEITAPTPPAQPQPAKEETETVSLPAFKAPEEHPKADAQEPPKTGSPEEVKTQPEAQTPAEEPPAEPKVQEREPYEVQYRVLQGKYNREISAIREENQRLSEQIRTMQANLAPVAQPVPQTAGPKLNTATLDLTPEEKEWLQDESFKSALSKVIAQAVKPLEDRLAKADEGLAQSLRSNVQAREDAFWGAVYQAMPDFDRLLDRDHPDPDWSAYMNTYDPRFGMSARDAASAAVQNLNPERMVAIINDFNRTVAAKKAAQTPPPPAPPKPPVMVSQPGPGQAPSTPAPKIWPYQEWKGQYDAWTRGEYGALDGAEATAKKLELDTAQREGRVKFG